MDRRFISLMAAILYSSPSLNFSIEKSIETAYLIDGMIKTKEKSLPSSEDLDKVAEEENIKALTGATSLCQSL